MCGPTRAAELTVGRMRQVGVAVGSGGERQQETVRKPLRFAFGRDIGAPLKILDLADLGRQGGKRRHHLVNVRSGGGILELDQDHMP